MRLREGKVGRSDLPFSNARRVQVWVYALDLTIASEVERHTDKVFFEVGRS
jgi:hypothetical protein